VTDVNEIIKNIFSDTNLLEIICSLYERELTPEQLAEQNNLDELHLAEQIKLLEKYKLIRQVNKEGIKYYTSANPKVCDSIISLKDALYNSVGE